MEQLTFRGKDDDSGTVRFWLFVVSQAQSCSAQCSFGKEPYMTYENVQKLRGVYRRTISRMHLAFRLVINDISADEEAWVSRERSIERNENAQNGFVGSCPSNSLQKSMGKDITASLSSL